MRTRHILPVAVLIVRLMVGDGQVRAATLEDGVAAYKRGEYPVAISLLEKAVQAEPGRASSHCWLGVAYAQYASSSRAAGTLKTRAAAELEKAVSLDRQGPYGKLAREWLLLLRPPVPRIAIGGFARASEFPQERAEDIRRRALRGLKACQGIRVAGPSAAGGRRSVVRESAGAEWSITVTTLRWEVTEPTQEEIAKAKGSKGSILSRLGKIATVTTHTRAGARVVFKHLSAPREQPTEVLVEISHLQLGYGSTAVKTCGDEAALQLANAIVDRVRGFFEMRADKPITAGLQYVRRPMGSSYAIAAVASLDQAEKLPTIAVSPFAWGEGLRDGKQIGQYGANMVARSLIASHKYAVIIPQDFHARTGVDPVAFALTETAREAGKKIQADYVVAGEVTKIESFINQAVLKDKKVKSKASVSFVVLSCLSPPAVAEVPRTCIGEGTRPLPSGTEVKTPADVADLRDGSIRLALADAADEVAKALESLRRPNR